MTYATLLVGTAIGLVAVVLILGLANMMRGGSPSMSQTLMRWRVILQALAIALIFLVLWVRA
jgi:hypothetical protein